MLPKVNEINIGGNLEVVSSCDAPSKSYRIDFENKKISGFVDGIEAMQQAIYKTLQTERFVYLIYSWNYGIESNGLINKSYDIFISEAERVIKEALIEDERVLDVKDFVFNKIDGRSVAVSFICDTVFGKVIIEREVLRRG